MAVVRTIDIGGKRYVHAFGIPYAHQNDDNTVTCPRCKARIQQVERKDFESFTGIEYQLHYSEQHATDDGRVQVDGVWYEPEE